MGTLYCACCGQPFQRTSARGPAPLYCSRDCRRQMEVRRRVWSSMEAVPSTSSIAPAQAAWGLRRHGGRLGRAASA
ncbi:hypothetical protein [Azospirillum sp. sgz302134]